MARRRRSEDRVELEKETLEQFLARGGRIERLPPCVRTSDLEEQKEEKKKARKRAAR